MLWRVPSKSASLFPWCKNLHCMFWFCCSTRQSHLFTVLSRQQQIHFKGKGCWTRVCLGWKFILHLKALIRWIPPWYPWLFPILWTLLFQSFGQKLEALVTCSAVHFWWLQSHLGTQDERTEREKQQGSPPLGTISAPPSDQVLLPSGFVSLQALLSVSSIIAAKPPSLWNFLETFQSLREHVLWGFSWYLLFQGMNNQYVRREVFCRNTCHELKRFCF